MYKYNTISDINDIMRRIGCFNKTQLDTQMHKAYINESLEDEDWHPVKHDGYDVKNGLKSKDHNEQIVITPSYSILYNCSKSQDIPSIIENGPNWEYCNAHAFGKGVYTNFQEWQAHESTWKRSKYGDTVVKYRYNGDLMKECLVLEPQLWRMSGNLRQQAERFSGLEDFLKRNGSSIEDLEKTAKGNGKGSYSANASQKLISATDREFPRSKGDAIYHKSGNFYGAHCDDVLMRFGIQGIIHYGHTDGPVAVIYNSHKLQALEYCTIKNTRQHRANGHNLQWTKIPEGKGINTDITDTRPFTHFLSDKFEGNPLHLRPRCGELLMRDKKTHNWTFVDVAKAEDAIYRGVNDDVRLFGDFEFVDALNFNEYGGKELAYVQLDNDKTSRFYIDKGGNLYQNTNDQQPISHIKTYYANENEPINNDINDDDIDIDDENGLKDFENMFGFGMLESIRKMVRKSLNEEIVRPLVNNIMSILSIIDRTWKSPDDLYYIKIDQRFKDFRNFNVDKGLNTHDRGAKRWKQEDQTGKDSTKRENHVGYCIVRGRTKEDCKECALNATVHLNPWAAKMYGKDTLHSNGGMEAIIEICHRFFARAYMVINPRSMKRTIDRAREDKKIGRFRGREFHHRAGQSKSGFDGKIDWDKVYPDALIDCDISDPNAWKDVENLLKANGCQIYNKMKSHQGVHFIVNYDECKNIDFTPIMNKYPSFNKPGDPAILLKHDANTMVYSPAGIRESKNPFYVPTADECDLVEYAQQWKDEGASFEEWRDMIRKQGGFGNEFEDDILLNAWNDELW